MVTRFFSYSSLPEPVRIGVPSASAVNGAGGWIAVEYDDAIAGATEELDSSMMAAGFVADPTAGAELRLRSPNGTVWALRVDDAGALSIVAVP